MKFRTRALSIASATVLVTGAVAIDTASAGTTPQFYGACLNIQTHQLINFRINYVPACPAAMRSVSWNYKGLRGAVGPRGHRGKTGATVLRVVPRQ